MDGTGQHEAKPAPDPSPNTYVNDRTLGRIRTRRPNNVTAATSRGATPARGHRTR